MGTSSLLVVEDLPSIQLGLFCEYVETLGVRYYIREVNESTVEYWEHKGEVFLGFTCVPDVDKSILINIQIARKEEEINKLKSLTT